METGYKKTPWMEKVVSLDVAKRLYEIGYKEIADHCYCHTNVPVDENMSYEDALDLVADGTKTEEEVFELRWQLETIVYRNGDNDTDGEDTYYYAAPFITDVQDWLRENYGIFTNAVSKVVDNHAVYIPVIERTTFNAVNTFPTYYSALDHAVCCGLDHVGNDFASIDDSYIVIVDESGQVQRLKVRKALRLDTECGRGINVADIEDDTYAIQITNKEIKGDAILFRLTRKTMSVFLTTLIVYDEKFGPEIMTALKEYMENEKGEVKVTIFDPNNKTTVENLC